MANASVMRPARSLAAMIAIACVFNEVRYVSAQQGWTSAANRLLPLVGDAPPEQADAHAAQSMNRRSAGASRALARLIANPDQTDGSPPYALTDQNGTIQRYVEPVPGVDLESHLGQVVVVRSDTGPTLLASQLDLPRERLLPLMGAGGWRGGATSSPTQSAWRHTIDSRVEPAQYVDNDDSSVQLLPEDMPLPDGVSAGPGQASVMGDTTAGYGGYPMMGGPMYGPAGAAPYGDVVYWDPTMSGPGMAQPFAGPMVGACPPCGDCQNAPGMYLGVEQACDGNCPPANPGPQFSLDIQLLFLRVHMADAVAGKLSEKFEFTPRFILNARNIGALDGRVRYWTYGRDTSTNAGGDVRFEWDVLDIEAVHTFEGRRSKLELAAGVRLADVQLIDTTDEGSGSHMIGLTMAADGLTPLISLPGGYCGWIYGGRLSLLGGDWGADMDGEFLNQQVLDDNIVVTELYAGAEVARKCRHCTVRGRAFFEIQNWRSDVLASEAGIESIGFLGPALQIGADF